MPTVEQCPPELSKKEKLYHAYREAARGLHVASQLSATSLDAELEPLIVELKAQLHSLHQQLLDAGMKPHELSSRAPGHG